ncbi:hypothetical protein G9A89_008114 [Geosiphon pyriformis]|nr:hypothetical protein G9A89_008114 [Geosiphon pyriformis]
MNAQEKFEFFFDQYLTHINLQENTVTLPSVKDLWNNYPKNLKIALGKAHINDLPSPILCQYFSFITSKENLASMSTKDSHKPQESLQFNQPASNSIDINSVEMGSQPMTAKRNSSDQINAVTSSNNNLSYSHKKDYYAVQVDQEFLEKGGRFPHLITGEKVVNHNNLINSFDINEAYEFAKQK